MDEGMWVWVTCETQSCEFRVVLFCMCLVCVAFVVLVIIEVNIETMEWEGVVFLFECKHICWVYFIFIVTKVGIVDCAYVI